MAKKVAYVVFEGHKPGLYSTWNSLTMQHRLKQLTHLLIRADTKEQTHEYAGSKQRGYNIADGGRDAAERAYAEYISSKQSEIEIGGGQDDGSEKQDANFLSGKEVG